jgi:S-adenosylmethionine:tRNA ribosyltransferase-isomerase
MNVSALDYELPPELIAQAPLPERDASRLLVVARDAPQPSAAEEPAGAIAHRSVRELPQLLAAGTLIVLNDTKVLPARLYAYKPSGGRVELLLVERLSPRGAAERWLALGQTRRGLRVGMHLRCPAPGGEPVEGGTPRSGGPAAIEVRVAALLGQGELEVVLEAPGGVEAALARVGRTPLPPYIRRAASVEDEARYQTVFAVQPGAVAAPTAGLHLSETLLAALRARGCELVFVTLHVGPGTFAPLRSDELGEHRMHAERYHVPEATAEALARAKREGRPVLAVGTTVVRTLEAAADEQGALAAGSGATSIFIYPPYRFRVVDALLTNFHLPRSTLLALVMAFAGEERTRRAYAEAVAARYRFFSYGDAMLIRGRP